MGSTSCCCQLCEVFVSSLGLLTGQELDIQLGGIPELPEIAHLCSVPFFPTQGAVVTILTFREQYPRCFDQGRPTSLLASCSLVRDTRTVGRGRESKQPCSSAQAAKQSVPVQSGKMHGEYEKPFEPTDRLFLCIGHKSQ